LLVACASKCSSSSERSSDGVLLAGLARAEGDAGEVPDDDTLTSFEGTTRYKCAVCSTQRDKGQPLAQFLEHQQGKKHLKKLGQALERIGLSEAAQKGETVTGPSTAPVPLAGSSLATLLDGCGEVQPVLEGSDAGLAPAGADASSLPADEPTPAPVAVSVPTVAS
jgi:hypothetical protein